MTVVQGVCENRHIPAAADVRRRIPRVNCAVLRFLTSAATIFRTRFWGNRPVTAELAERGCLSRSGPAEFVAPNEVRCVYGVASAAAEKAALHRH